MLQRALFVHAHPDDEAISTGGTIAALVDAGVAVTVLTCTRGERGEVIPPELQHLEGTAAIVPERERELRAALAALGVTDARRLGEPGARRAGLPPRVYTDSGMRWGADGPEPPADLAADSLVAADLGAVAADIAQAALDTGAQVVVGYDEDGGYGHPDHVRASEAARRAADVLGLPYFAVAVEQDAAHVRGDLAPTPPERWFAEDAEVVVVDATAQTGRRRAALAAHRTQLVLHEHEFELSNGSRHPIEPVEVFTRIAPQREQEEPTPLGWVIVGALAVLVAGAVIGAVGTVGHRFAPPAGIVLALGALTAFLAGLRLVTGRRLLTIAAAVGALAAQALFALPSPGGSVLVPDDVLSAIWTYGSILVVLVTLAWPTRIGRIRAGRRPSASPSARSPRADDAGLPG